MTPLILKEISGKVGTTEQSTIDSPFGDGNKSHNSAKTNLIKASEVLLGNTLSRVVKMRTQTPHSAP